MVQEASRGSKNASRKGECCPGGHPPQLQELFPGSCLWFNECHSKWLSPVLPPLTCKTPISFLPSQQVQPHWTLLCLSQRLQGAEDGEEGGYTHTSGTFSVSLYALPVASSWCWWPPSSPHTPQCPSSQLSPAFPLLLGASLSHCLEKQQLVRTGVSPVSQESPLGQAPFPYWPDYGSCIAHVQPTDRQVASFPQSQALSGHSLRHQKLLILIFTGSQTQLEGGVSYGLVVRQSLKQMWIRSLLMLPGENCNSGAVLWKSDDGVTMI